MRMVRWLVVIVFWCVFVGCILSCSVLFCGWRFGVVIGRCVRYWFGCLIWNGCNCRCGCWLRSFWSSCSNCWFRVRCGGYCLMWCCRLVMVMLWLVLVVVCGWRFGVGLMIMICRCVRVVLLVGWLMECCFGLVVWELVRWFWIVMLRCLGVFCWVCGWLIWVVVWKWICLVVICCVWLVIFLVIWLLKVCCMVCSKCFLLMVIDWILLVLVIFFCNGWMVCCVWLCGFCVKSMWCGCWSVKFWCSWRKLFVCWWWLFVFIYCKMLCCVVNVWLSMIVVSVSV